MFNKNDKWEFYKDASNEGCWCKIATNGKIAGASIEGYKNKQDSIDNTKRESRFI